MKRYKCKKSIHLNQGKKKLSKLNRIRRKLVSKNRFRMAKNISLNLGGVYEYPD